MRRSRVLYHYNGRLHAADLDDGCFHDFERRLNIADCNINNKGNLASNGKLDILRSFYVAVAARDYDSKPALGGRRIGGRGNFEPVTQRGSAWQHGLSSFNRNPLTTGIRLQRLAECDASI